MSFQELILQRQSDRKYSDKKVEESLLTQCLEAARMAPSACNAQPWKFIVVDDPALKQQVADSAASLGMNKFTFEAPVIVVITLEKPNLTSKIGSVLKNKEYTLIDIGVVANQFCLQAADLGLATCMIGWFDEKRLRKILGIPSSRRVPLIITVGYSDAEKRTKIRKDFNQIVSRNKY